MYLIQSVYQSKSDKINIYWGKQNKHCETMLNELPQLDWVYNHGFFDNKPIPTKHLPPKMWVCEDEYQLVSMKQIKIF